MVCENHPDYPFDLVVEGHDGSVCGPGMPCGYCCPPIPEFAGVPIGWAFTPDWKRPDWLREMTGAQS